MTVQCSAGKSCTLPFFCFRLGWYQDIISNDFSNSVKVYSIHALMLIIHMKLPASIS